MINIADTDTRTDAVLTVAWSLWKGGGEHCVQRLGQSFLTSGIFKELGIGK